MSLIQCPQCKGLDCKVAENDKKECNSCGHTWGLGKATAKDIEEGDGAVFPSIGPGFAKAKDKAIKNEEKLANRKGESVQSEPSAAEEDEDVEVSAEDAKDLKADEAYQDAKDNE